jgi:hypothetical protein
MQIVFPNAKDAPISLPRGARHQPVAFFVRGSFPLPAVFKSVDTKATAYSAD